ncbi:hypothetical protein [Escherichia coli]|nr:hypothetical protein [Escherichia coli]
MDACYHGDDDNGMMLSDGVTVRAVMMDTLSHDRPCPEKKKGVTHVFY